MKMDMTKSQKTTLVGSLIAAVVASVCCIGPVVLAVLGIGSTAFIAKFGTFRPVLIVITLLFLGGAFYLTYRKKPAEECDPESYCAHPKSDRINKIILWIATGFVVLFLLSPYWIGVFI